MAELICDKIARLENKARELEHELDTQVSALQADNEKMARGIEDVLRYLCPSCKIALEKIKMFRRIVNQP